MQAVALQWGILRVVYFSVFFLLLPQFLGVLPRNCVWSYLFPGHPVSLGIHRPLLLAEVAKWQPALRQSLLRLPELAAP